MDTSREVKHDVSVVCWCLLLSRPQPSQRPDHDQARHQRPGRLSSKFLRVRRRRTWYSGASCTRSISLCRTNRDATFRQRLPSEPRLPPPLRYRLSQMTARLLTPLRPQCPVCSATALLTTSWPAVDPPKPAYASLCSSSIFARPFQQAEDMAWPTEDVNLLSMLVAQPAVSVTFLMLVKIAHTAALPPIFSVTSTLAYIFWNRCVTLACLPRPEVAFVNTCGLVSETDCRSASISRDLATHADIFNDSVDIRRAFLKRDLLHKLYVQRLRHTCSAKF